MLSMKSTSRDFNWMTAIWLAIIHIGAMGALYYSTWGAVCVFGLLFFITGCIGVCLGYHRYLTHGSFKTYRIVRWLLVFIGQLSGEGSAIFWVARHRQHHVHSDQPGDPHTPKEGFFWSHFRWLLWRDKKNINQRYLHWAPDLMKDPVIYFLHRTFIIWHMLLLAGLYWWGSSWDTFTGISFVVWGMCVRMVLVLHSSWIVNSAAHTRKWGYQTYETKDESNNLLWVFPLTFGDGWHNNHHKVPWAANHGHKRWELDPTYWIIRLMGFLGLAWKIRTYHPS